MRQCTCTQAISFLFSSLHARLRRLIYIRTRLSRIERERARVGDERKWQLEFLCVFRAHVFRHINDVSTRGLCIDVDTCERAADVVSTGLN